MISYDDAYPNVEFLPRSRNWWAWLKGTPAECVHLGSESEWIATLVPDIICLQGKRRKRRDPIRPEITLCRKCLAETATPDLAEYEGRTVAFEPDPELLSQYFFIEKDDFAAAGLMPEVADASRRGWCRMAVIAKCAEALERGSGFHTNKWPASTK
ncbi:MAG TPA: hypothetical protein VIH97_06140 [Candidatus Acidoferrales bacterium]